MSNFGALEGDMLAFYSKKMIRRPWRLRRRPSAYWWVSLAVTALTIASCQMEDDASPKVGMTLQELALENARECVGIYTYPQALIDGLSVQLIDELRCMDPGWLEYYTPCKDVGCIWAYGPQPLAARPEVLEALRAAAASKNDYITITAGYRDVAMQYFSRWFRENCNPNFHAAEPGRSNHQGGRAIDVQSYNFWHSTLLEHGFVHAIPTDRPHFELYRDSQYRAESAELRSLSLKAFQVLWNKNHPDDQIDEDGLYGPQTKSRLGSSPIEGFPISGCEPVVDPCELSPCADGCDPAVCGDFCDENPCDEACPAAGCEFPCEADPCADGCSPQACIALCDDSPCDPACGVEGCELFCEANPCDDQCVGYHCEPTCDGEPCETPDPDPCRDETCGEECIGDSCLDEPDQPDDDLTGDDDGNGDGHDDHEGEGGSVDRRELRVTGGGGCAAAPGAGSAIFASLALGVILRRRRR